MKLPLDIEPIGHYNYDKCHEGVGMQTESQISNVLGGSKFLGKQTSSYFDFDQIIRDGLPWESVLYAKNLLGLTNEQLASVLDVSQRTLARLSKDKKRLTTAAGDRLYRLAHIFSFAKEVLEGEKPALDWLHHPQVGLGGRIPLDLIRTEAGSREVEDLLGRMEYGVIS